MQVRIEMWSRATAPPIGALVDAADREGFSFVRRTLDEWVARSNRFDLIGEALFLAVDDDGVIGMCGLNVDPFIDDVAVGRVRHLYVAPGSRRRGVGSLLLAAVVRRAEQTFERLRLRTFDHAAAEFYVDAGLTEVDEEAATHALVLRRH